MKVRNHAFVLPVRRASIRGLEGSPLSGVHGKSSTKKRLRELLGGVKGLEDTIEVGLVIDLLKQMDGVPAHLQPEVLAILQSFRALPRGTQDRLLPLLAQVLNASDDKK